MQVKFEFAIYDEALDKFELDENTYSYELSDEQAKTYNLLKSRELHLYNFFKESESISDWIKEEVYPNKIGKKIAICDINEISFRRYYFFKVTSADVHYDYFKKLFGIHHESDWQDREEVGEEILERLLVKRQELIIELKEDAVEDEKVEPNEEGSQVSAKNFISQ
ncbi:hypothetical protein M947_05385 [Sulfurimonas hongkongensis]|uniref:Uncharacterized protein n=1 Tax=Sulfurimonas hongkongensis TaxID=1172190 RepID=T0JEI6_9BACT|nr:hypothetical protein [Sulfurimonas hongkongensis]EQB39425.1 hypothetical protein M947_05385 [Sulfurimonas hongkongensis]